MPANSAIPTLLLAAAALAAGPTTVVAPPPVASAATTASPVVTPADAEQAYAAALRQLAAGQSALVAARQQAVLDYRSTPVHAAVSRDLSAAFDAYAERRNATLLGLETHDPRVGPWRKGVADADAQIARDEQNPAVTPDAFGELLRQRAGFAAQLQAAEDDAVNRDPDLKRLQQRWRDAAAKLADARAAQPAAAEAAPAVRSATAAVAAARAAVDHARSALPAGVQPDEPGLSAEEFVRRYPRHGLGWADVGLSYGGTARPPGK